jgi:DNA-binding response OmpR family regulator
MPDAGPRAARRRLLIVEDEPRIRELVRLHLGLAGFDATECSNGTEGLERARAEKFDLIVLDVMLPGLDGITLCRAIRTQGANMHTAILMVTARESESDTVLGLESGADDYLAKPFGVRELAARAAALLRRSGAKDAGASPPAPGVHARDVTIDIERRDIVVRGASVELTKQEFDLLYQLASRRGIVFSRAALLAKVWSGDTYVTERTVDTVVSRLRRKIERDPQDPELILTAWGVGYKFVDAE